MQLGTLVTGRKCLAPARVLVGFFSVYICEMFYCHLTEREKWSSLSDRKIIQTDTENVASSMPACRRGSVYTEEFLLGTKV